MSQIPKLPEKAGCRPLVADTHHQFAAGYEMAQKSYNNWYAKLEAWHAEVFKDAVEVYGGSFKSTYWTFCSDKEHQKTTHTALLINIQPIKEDTAEDILREIISRLEVTFHGEGGVYGGPRSKLYEIDIFAKAKAFLEKKRRSHDK